MKSKLKKFAALSVLWASAAVTAGSQLLSKDNPDEDKEFTAVSMSMHVEPSVNNSSTVYVPG